MKKSKFLGIKDYLALIVRRKWWVLVTFVVSAGAAALFTAIVPDIYESNSMIMIQQRDIPSEFVKDLIAGNTEQRLSIIEKTILSRTNLLKVLDKFEDDLDNYRGLNDQVKVMKLTGKINIEFPTERVRGVYLPISNIVISYRDRDPELAQKITQELTTLFMKQDRMAREDHVQGTTDFLTSELKKVAEQLEQSESTIQALKSRYRYELPSERDTNLRTLDRLQDQKNSNIEALDRYVSMRLTLRQQLSEIPEFIPLEQARRVARNTQRDPAVEAYLSKEREYKELSARAKETHPQVRRLKAELEELKKDLPEGAIDEIPDAAATGADESPEPDMAPNPAYQNLLTQLKQIDTEIGIREREKNRIADEIALYTRRVENTPKVEQEIAAVLRANEDLEKEHNSLKEKLTQAKLSQSAETSQRGSQFNIQDPADLPSEPAPPSRWLLFLAGLAISLGLGLGVAFFVDILSPVVITQGELERALKTKVLIEVPRITTPSDVKKIRRMGTLYAASFIVLVGMYGGFLYLLYEKKHRLVQILNPLIERIQG